MASVTDLYSSLQR